MKKLITIVALVAMISIASVAQAATVSMTANIATETVDIGGCTLAFGEITRNSTILSGSCVDNTITANTLNGVNITLTGGSLVESTTSYTISGADTALLDDECTDTSDTDCLLVDYFSMSGGSPIYGNPTAWVGSNDTENETSTNTSGVGNHIPFPTSAEALVTDTATGYLSDQTWDLYAVATASLNSDAGTYTGSSTITIAEN